MPIRGMPSRTMGRRPVGGSHPPACQRGMLGVPEASTPDASPTSKWMMMRSRSFGRAAACLSMALLLTTFRADAQEAAIGDIGYVLGDLDAPVAVVEFGDFACSACGEFSRETWPRIKLELVDTGRISWRHVPFLLGFRRGDDAANAAECAAEQGGFWPMHDRLFAGQREWLRDRRPTDVFRTYASAIGLDLERFSACYGAERGEGRTRAATRVARSADVRGTPTFLIGDRRAVGAIPYELFLEIVEDVERSLVDGKAGTR